MAELRWIGWDRRAETDDFVRSWAVEAGSRPLGVRKGDVLVDRGPGAGRRWDVRRRRDSLRGLTDAEAATLFPDGVIPLWDPPSRRDLELLAALREGNRRAAESERHLLNLVVVVTQIKDLYLIHQRDGEERAAGQGRQAKRRPAERRGMLRLVARRRYAHGEAYNVWELTADAPWIAVGFNAPGGKAHAQAGDQLVEQPEDGEDPWILKRGGRDVAHPEAWQMAGILEAGCAQRETVAVTFKAESDQAAVERLLGEASSEVQNG